MNCYRGGRINRINVACHCHRSDDVDIAFAWQNETDTKLAFSIANCESNGIGRAQPSHDIEHFVTATRNDDHIARLKRNVFGSELPRLRLP